MNWTEGALARHSRRKDRDPSLARQKEYFAKSRTGRKSTSTTQSAFVPAFIAQPIPERPSSTLIETFGAPSLSNVSRSPIPTPETSFNVGNARERVEARSVKNCRLGNKPETQEVSVDVNSKRRKLLEQSDWTGITRLKPPEIDLERIRHEYLTRKRPRRTSPRRLSSAKSRSSHHHKRSVDHQDADEESIRMCIGSKRFRWDRANGSPQTARTLLSSSIAQSSIAQSSGATRSMASSPPITIPALLVSSPASHLSRTSSASARRVSKRSARIWRRPSTESVAAPFMGDDPRYVVQSIPPRLLFPAPKHNRAALHRQGSIRNAESTVDSLIAEDGRSSVTNATDQNAEAEWKAFISGRDDKSDDGGSLPESRNAMQCADPPHIFRREIVGLTLQQPSNAMVVVAGQHSPTRKSTGLTRCGGKAAAELNPHRDSNDPTPQNSNELLPEDQEQDGAAMAGWVEDPAVRNMRAGKLVTQNMAELLDKQISRTRAMQSKPHPGPGNDPTAEEELWRRFLFDDEPAKIAQKAERLAMEQTKRQILQEKAAIRSDEAEAPSSICEGVSAITDQATPFKVNLSSTSDSESDCEVRTDMESMSAMSTLAERGSPSRTSSKATNFKMHVPPPFVGRLSTTTSEGRHMGSHPQTTSHVARGLSKGKKKWKSGRLEIRALPDFDDDPIEEDA